MKTTLTIPVHPEYKTGRFEYLSVYPKKPNETILKTFARWCKSELTGKPGTIALSMADRDSTFDGTGSLCPIYGMAGNTIRLHSHVMPGSSISSLFNF